MKGSVHEFRGAWFVRWWDNTIKRDRKIYRYKGEKMYSRKTAEKLLALMQAEVENGTFYLEKYLNVSFSEVIPFIDGWLEGLPGTVSPATLKGYRSYVKNHIGPYFKKRNNLTLADIQLDTIKDLMRSLKNTKREPLSPKMKLNVISCLHVILDEAWRSRRIVAMPAFPRANEYQLEEPVIKWLPEDRQLSILEKIPQEHQPIFYFLKYHLRRPAEAIALHKEDFDGVSFRIHRSISARQLTGKTKTGEIHNIPCHPDFRELLDIEKDKQIRHGLIFSPFMFVNPMARRQGKRYTNESLNIIWKAACKEAGEDIDLYSGLKHSSCSQYINERGLSESELQVITDHARLESVRRYAKTEVARKMELMVKRIKKANPPKPSNLQSTQ